jgi:hypothetical protein
MTTPANFTPTGHSWIYGSAPQVEDIPGTQRYTVSVELVTVPPEGANINGAEFTVSIALTAGAVSASSNATGASLTVTTSIATGAAEAYSADGFNLTVSVTLAAGGSGDSDYYVDWVIQTYGFEADIYPSWWAS